MKAIKTITFKKSDKEIIRSYLEFTKPIHKLTDREMNFLTELIHKYYVEKEYFKREEDLWKKVFDYDSKLEDKKNLGIQDTSLQNLLSTLRKKKAINRDRVVESFIPDLSKDELILAYRWIKS